MQCLPRTCVQVCPFMDAECQQLTLSLLSVSIPGKCEISAFCFLSGVLMRIGFHSDALLCDLNFLYAALKMRIFFVPVEMIYTMNLSMFRNIVSKHILRNMTFCFTLMQSNYVQPNPTSCIIRIILWCVEILT